MRRTVTVDEPPIMEMNGNVVEDIKQDSESNLKLEEGEIPQVNLTKTANILDACKWRDIGALQALAASEGGLLSDKLRRQAWPLLLGCAGEENDEKAELRGIGHWQSLTPHHDEDQVRLDVDRSFVYYPTIKSDKELDLRKEELSDLITEVLRRQPYLHYFQGYHDICQVFLLVLAPYQRAEAVARLSTLRIRDFMLPTLAPALVQLRLIPAIINSVNPALYHHLSQTRPFFALSGTLTMYAHDIQEYGDIARLFDILLAREAVFSVYLFAQIVLSRADELFDTPSDEPEMLHSILSKLPKPLDLEALLASTIQLFNQHPPEALRGWRAISSASVLKTTRWQAEVAKQTLQDGHVFFNRQVKELQWADRKDRIIKVLWSYRRPASAIGAAVLVGALSYHLKKSSGGFGFMLALQRWSIIGGF